MNEKDLGEALLKGQDQIDIQALTESVLRRDRRRIWILGIVCVIAWMAVVMLPWSTILPMLAKIGERQFELSKSAPPSTAESHEQMLDMARAMKTGIMATFFGSIASMFVAAVCTVLLIIVSRRATLRQVNARLREISLQIKNLSVTR
jgi:hypothetical protein